VTLIHLLAAYGICFGLMNKVQPVTDILKRIPRLGGFFGRQLSCPYCTGFHCGWVVYLIEAVRTGLSTTWYAEILLLSFAASAFCYGSDVAVRWLEANTVTDRFERS
jgi:hypothetical protein